MTRQELTGVRSLEFSQWIRTNLPDSSTGYSVSDLDFIIWNWKTKKIILLEIKTRMSTPRKGQYLMWNNIERWIQNGIDSDWMFYGFHFIKFENTNFADGKVYYDDEEITENDLNRILSLESDS